MSTIERYLSKTMLYYFFLVMFFLVGFQIFLEFTKEFSSIGIGAYSFYHATIYVLLLLPHNLYQFFPIAGLLGFVLALGLLNACSELIVIRTAGVSLARLSWMVIKTSLGLIILMGWLGEGIAPSALRSAEKLKLAAISGGSIALMEREVWLVNSQEIINIKAVSEGKISGITRYTFGKDYGLNKITHAAEGYYNGKNWVLNQLVGTSFGKDKTTAISDDSEVSSLTFPQLVELDSLKQDHQSLLALYKYIQQRTQSGLETAKYLFAFWQRIFAPLAALIMLLLALPFVVGYFRQATLGLKMLVGIMVGFVFFILQQLVGPMAIVYQIPPILAASLPSLFFAGLAAALLFRLR